MREKFWVFDAEMFERVDQCLAWEGSGTGDSERMRATLKLLAETGFAPLQARNDPVARVISENDVGGVVAMSALVIGLNSNVWSKHGCVFGLVPSKQSIRLVIAQRLAKARTI